MQNVITQVAYLKIKTISKAKHYIKYIQAREINVTKTLFKKIITGLKLLCKLTHTYITLYSSKISYNGHKSINKSSHLAPKYNSNYFSIW